MNVFIYLFVRIDSIICNDDWLNIIDDKRTKETEIN